MKPYIGCKIVQAEPMDYLDFSRKFKTMNPTPVQQDGHMVVYPDGYISWSPKDVFEKAYRSLTPAEQEIAKPLSTPGRAD